MRKNDQNDVSPPMDDLNTLYSGSFLKFLGATHFLHFPLPDDDLPAICILNILPRNTLILANSLKKILAIMKYLLLLASLTSCFFTSCVTGRRTISPTVPVAAHSASKGSVEIMSIRDVRVFQNKPSNPSTPSVKGDHTQMSAAEKNRMAGRQRNTFGKAMGDIALSPGDTIENKMRALITEAFARRGYTVRNGSRNRASADVPKFWAWFTPGMWYIKFEAVIEARIKVTKGGRSRSFTLTGKGTNGGQVASNANWNHAYELAFEDFITKLEAELQRSGF